MGKVSPILPETAPQQSQPFQPWEYSNECPQPALEFVLQAQEPQSPDKMANEGTMDVGSSCSHGSNVMQHILSVVVVNLEPAISLWAQFFHHTHWPSNEHLPLFEMGANQCDQGAVHGTISKCWSATGLWQVDSCYGKIRIICTNNAVYTHVWPCIGASYNHLLHDKYNLIQCISGVQVRNNITTQGCYTFLHYRSGAGTVKSLYQSNTRTVLQLRPRRYKKSPETSEHLH